MAEIDRLVIKITADVNQLKRDMSKATGVVKQSSTRMERSFGGVNRSMKSLTANAGGLRTALAAVGAGLAIRAVSKQFLDFDSNMVRIISLVGIAKDQVDEWRESILQLAPATGVGPAELSDALFAVSSAGLRGAEAMDTLESAAQASAIGLGNTRSIALALVSSINAYGSSVLNASQASDILVKAVREGNFAAEELAGSLGKILPAAVSAGVSFAEVGATVASLTRIGLSASEAITGLQGILAALNRETSTGAEKLEAAGTSFADLRKEIVDKGLLSALNTMAKAVDNDAAALTDILGRVEGTNAVLALTGPLASSVSAIFDSLTNAVGTTGEAFSIVSNSARQELNVALAELQVSMVSLGNRTIPQLAKAIGLLAEHLDEAAVAAGALIGLRLGARFGIWGLAIGGTAGALLGYALVSDSAADAQGRLNEQLEIGLTSAERITRELVKATGQRRAVLQAEREIILAQAVAETQLRRRELSTVRAKPGFRANQPAVLQLEFDAEQALLSARQAEEQLRDAFDTEFAPSISVLPPPAPAKTLRDPILSDEAKTARASITALVSALNDELRVLKLVGAEQDKERLIIQAENIARKGKIDLTDDEVAAITRLSDALQQLERDEAVEEIKEGNDELRKEIAALSAGADAWEEYQRARDIEEEIEQLRESLVLVGDNTEATDALVAARERLLGQSAELQDGLEDQKDAVDNLKSASEELGRTMSSAFEDAIIRGEDLAGVLEGLAEQIQRVLTRILVTRPLDNFLSGLLAPIVGAIAGGGGGGGGGGSTANMDIFHRGGVAGRMSDYHEGGRVVRNPSMNGDVIARLRAGETIRTPSQEAALSSAQGGARAAQIINIHMPPGTTARDARASAGVIGAQIARQLRLHDARGN